MLEGHEGDYAHRGGARRCGLATLRFDFTGLGGSEGEFANTDFSSNVADLVAAARWLEAEHRAPSLLVGHSLGGAAVLAAAARIPSVTAVATINAPSDPAHLRKLFAGAGGRDPEHLAPRRWTWRAARSRSAANFWTTSPRRTSRTP